YQFVKWVDSIYHFQSQYSEDVTITTPSFSLATDYGHDLIAYYTKNELKLQATDGASPLAVPFTVTADKNGAGGGTTPASRLYVLGTSVTLTAPAMVGGLY